MYDNYVYDNYQYDNYQYDNYQIVFTIFASSGLFKMEISNHDILFLIAYQIDDPLTFRNFAFVSRHTIAIAKELRNIKESEFYPYRKFFEYGSFYEFIFDGISDKRTRRLTLPPKLTNYNERDLCLVGSFDYNSGGYKFEFDPFRAFSDIKIITDRPIKSIRIYSKNHVNIQEFSGQILRLIYSEDAILTLSQVLSCSHEHPFIDCIHFGNIGRIVVCFDGPYRDIDVKLKLVVVGNINNVIDRDQIEDNFLVFVPRYIIYKSDEYIEQLIHINFSMPLGGNLLGFVIYGYTNIDDTKIYDIFDCMESKYIDINVCKDYKISKYDTILTGKVRFIRFTKEKVSDPYNIESYRDMLIPYVDSYIMTFNMKINLRDGFRVCVIPVYSRTIWNESMSLCQRHIDR